MGDTVFILVFTINAVGSHRVIIPVQCTAYGADLKSGFNPFIYPGAVLFTCDPQAFLIKT